jgi:hypothetical protein
MIMLSQSCEALKYQGLPVWEKDIMNAMEDLRNVKEYCTLQA